MHQQQLASLPFEAVESPSASALKPLSLSSVAVMVGMGLVASLRMR
jgi:hypothetical protein